MWTALQEFGAGRASANRPHCRKHSTRRRRLPRHGNRRVPFRGTTKNNAWLHTRVAALNLRRLLTLGLQHDTGRWVIA